MNIEIMLAAIGAVILLVGGIFMRGVKAGKDDAMADAAKDYQKAEERAREADAGAARDGADKRLRDGSF